MTNRAAKFKKDFNYTPDTKTIVSMTEYPKGFEGDIPESHYNAALEAGALEDAKPAASQSAADKGDKPK